MNKTPDNENEVKLIDLKRCPCCGTNDVEEMYCLNHECECSVEQYVKYRIRKAQEVTRHSPQVEGEKECSICGGSGKVCQNNTVTGSAFERVCVCQSPDNLNAIIERLKKENEGLNKDAEELREMLGLEHYLNQRDKIKDLEEKLDRYEKALNQYAFHGQSEFGGALARTALSETDNQKDKL